MTVPGRAKMMNGNALQIDSERPIADIMKPEQARIEARVIPQNSF